MSTARARSKVTVYDVAAAASCSIATVSRVVNQSASVSDRTRERVLSVIRDLQYSPSVNARALSTRRTSIMGFVFLRREFHGAPADTDPDVDRITYMDVVIRAAERAAEANGWSLLLSGVRPGDVDAVSALDGLVDAVVVMDGVLTPDQLDRLAVSSVPRVVLAGLPHAQVAGSVRGDNVGGTALLVEHLAEVHGVARLAQVLGPDMMSDLRVRGQAARRLAEERGMVLHEWPSAVGAAGAEAMVLEHGREHLARQAPQALLCGDDELAVGVLRGLRRLGVRVPEDVIVTGFDDLWIAGRVQPSLTTVRQPVVEVVEECVSMLRGAVDAGPGWQTRDRVLPTQLVVRESCGCSPRDPRVGAS